MNCLSVKYEKIVKMPVTIVQIPRWRLLMSCFVWPRSPKHECGKYPLQTREKKESVRLGKMDPTKWHKGLIDYQNCCQFFSVDRLILSVLQKIVWNACSFQKSFSVWPTVKDIQFTAKQNRKSSYLRNWNQGMFDIFDKQLIGSIISILDFEFPVDWLIVLLSKPSALM